MSTERAQRSFTNERLFPNHTFERDIGLAEYATAAAHLNSESKSVKWAASATILLSGGGGLATLQFNLITPELLLGTQEPKPTHLMLLLAVVLVSFISIVHLAELNKSRTFAERKVVALRRMLGVSYGENSLVLPNWRIEGADNPFALKFFRGWLDHRVFPIYMLLSVGSFAVFGLSFSLIAYLSSFLGVEVDPTFQNALIVACTYWLCGIATYKYYSRELGENLRLSLAKTVARLFRVPLDPNFMHRTYRVQLDIAEARRIKSDFETISKVAIFIEDRAFREHGGVNWRGTGRAVLGKIRNKKAGGGSSITQQFVRSNYIKNLNLGIRRKIVEILLARWIEKIWNKTSILNGYLTTVRFDRGVYGFHRAYKHFFEETPVNVSAWEAFILVERLGNIHGYFIANRVQALLSSSLEEGLLKTDDALACLKYYEGMMGHHFSLPDARSRTPADVIKALQLQTDID